MDWTLLGIEPVKDKKAITAAYRARLVQVNPEDKPEEFKALRAAYEEALRLADAPDEAPARDESPVGLWMEKVRALYGDFAARIRPDNWRALLSDEVCVALDKRPQAEEALLRFLMENYFVPQEVWQAFDEAFRLTERREELYENYPRDFVDHAVMNGIRYAASLPYEYFRPGTNAGACDDYRRLYYRANQTAPAEMGPILEQMDALPERHPYGDALRCRLLWEQGEQEQARAGYRALAEAYPDDNTLVMGWAAVCLQDEKLEEAERLFRHVLELTPDHNAAKRNLADCLAGQGQFTEAKELIYDLMRAAGGDQMRLHQLNEVLRGWNETLIQQREETLALHPEDTENALELGWCYLQNDRMDDALRAAQAADPNYEDQYAYHNLHGKMRYGRNEFELALEHLRTLERVIRAMEPDGTEKTAKRMRRLPEVLQMQGSCLMQLKPKQEQAARAKYEQALELAPDNAELLTYTGRLLCALRDYERAAEVLKKLTRVMPGSYHGYLLLAQCLYELRRDRDAFDAVNQALDLEGGDLGVYVLKMRILIRNRVWQEVHSILDFLKAHNVGEEARVVWCEALTIELEQKDETLALAKYRELAERVENGESLPWAAELYYRITELTGKQLDARKPEDRAELLAILEKGLTHDPEDMDCLDYKAWLLKRDERIDEALAIYLKLEALPRHYLTVEQNLAEIYYKDLYKNADKALHYYRMMQERSEHPDNHFYIGTCLRYLGEYETAAQSFLREQELAPDDVDGFNGLAYVYEALGRNEEALEQVEKAIALVADRDRDYTWLYNHKVQVLRRLGRPQEAIETTTLAIEKYQYAYGYEQRFEICCQFGLWEQAKLMLDAWKKSKVRANACAAAAIRLDLYTGRMTKARLALAAGKSKLNKGDLESLQLQIAELDADFAKPVEIWIDRSKGNRDRTNVLMNLAEAKLWAGDKAESVRLAEEAVALLEDKLGGCLNNEALYRSRLAMVLALAGRQEEARAQLARVRALPLCESCDYGACKDADIFEATMEDVWGNTDRALELFRAGMANWPDELDFATGVARINKRKGK